MECSPVATLDDGDESIDEWGEGRGGGGDEGGIGGSCTATIGVGGVLVLSTSLRVVVVVVGDGCLSDMSVRREKTMILNKQRDTGE